MQTDNLICLCCLLILLLYLLENIQILSRRKKKIVKKKKTNDKTKKSIVNFFDKFNNQEYTLVKPNKNYKPVSVTNCNYLDKYIMLILKKFTKKLNNNCEDNFFLNKSILSIKENYDKIYYVQTLFKLESNRHILKIEMNMMFITKKEYYITNIKLIEILRKTSSKYLRQSKIYNKWIIN